MSSTSFLQTFDPFYLSGSKVKPNSTRYMNRFKVRAVRREAHDHNSRGRVVDENMIVLRKRIHDMKMMEADSELPRKWMDWEKRAYESYDPIVCDVVGHLRSYLIETRPSVALGMVVLLALSVPTSTAVVMYNLLGLGNALLSGNYIHLG